MSKELTIMSGESQTDNMYCSLVPANMEESKTLFNATNNPDMRIKDCINQQIAIKHIFCEIVNMERENEETGETTQNPTPRVVLIDEQNKSYQSMSFGVYRSVQKLIKIFGEPSAWGEPIVVTVKQVNSKDRSMLTLQL